MPGLFPPKRILLPLAALSALALVAATGVSAPAPKTEPDPKNVPATEPATPAVDLAKIDNDPVLRVRNARNRAQSANNLKQIALAVHNYHDANGRLPADVLDKDGKPLLSWRVLLLPYIEEEPLYKQFKLDEPWNSDTNIQLLAKMPKLFESPRVVVKRRGYTVYQGFSGPDALFRHGKPPYTMPAITDGLSNTILAVETSAAVPWTQPADVPFDPKKDLPDFGKAYGQQPWAAMLDGSVRILDLKKIKPQTLKHAIGPADGEVLGKDWNE